MLGKGYGFRKGYEKYAGWSPTGKARGTSMIYPPTPLGTKTIRCARGMASEMDMKMMKNKMMQMQKKMSEIEMKK